MLVLDLDNDCVAFTIKPMPSLVSNKPESPEPIPSEQLFPITVEVGKGRTVWVSRPLPDKLVWMIDIDPKVYGTAVQADCDPGLLANGLFAYFSDYGKTISVIPSMSFSLNNPPKQAVSPSWRKMGLAVGARDSTVLLALDWKKKTIRVEMNPRKLGVAGIAALASAFGGHNAPFSWSALLEFTRVTRIDCCVDLVGVSVSEVAVWHKKQGQRSTWMGEDGALETVYVFKKKPKSQTAPKAGSKKRSASSIVSIYDRVRERSSVNKPPPFGPAPVTRVEVRKALRQKSLLSLMALKNPFSELRVGFVESQVFDSPSLWARFFALRRAMSFEEARRYSNISSALEASFAAAEQVPCADLIDPELVWSHWQDSLEQLGLTNSG